MRLSKWHGLGNDYLLLEQSEPPLELTLERAARLCDYHFGVGADGIAEVVSMSGDEVEVKIWNPDGSLAELSGNGVRIAARWLARRNARAEVKVRVGKRVVEARMLGGLEVEMDMGEVSVGKPETLEIAGEEIEFVPVSIGNPHAVIRREPERPELLRLGPLVERHPRFPERTNVQLVYVDGRHELTIAVWERGAGETLASGTSSVAAAAAAIAMDWCESPVTVHLVGGDLQVSLSPERRATLIGEAQEICAIELSPELLI
ncbi:MAG: diaminopimelate epimerase [Gaiellaceae bacterium]|jgi:diaminopimelate epimerase